MTDETSGFDDSQREYSLKELSELAGVTPRTVRYYIVEGLLPPPLTTGRNASYGQEHLDRLHAIVTLKEMYLPLREIRDRLDTLTPAQMRDPIYLASLSHAVGVSHAGRSARSRDERPSHNRREEQRPTRSMPELDPELLPSGQTWERIPLGDDAELLIRSPIAVQLGIRLYSTLHHLREMIESAEIDDE